MNYTHEQLAEIRERSITIASTVYEDLREKMQKFYTEVKAHELHLSLKKGTYVPRLFEIKEQNYN